MVKTTPVYFKSFRIGSSYLGPLSIVVARSRELMDLHDYTVGHLEQAHDIQVTSRWFPHMSLFYLGETFRGDRLRLAEILRSSGRVIEGRGIADIALNCTLDGAAPEFDAMTGFFGSELWLVDCSGAVDDWQVMEKRRLIRREPRLPRSRPFISRPIPVLPVVHSHQGFSGCIQVVPYMQRNEPFSYEPNSVPVISTSNTTPLPGVK